MSDSSVSDEARVRINSARQRDLAFAVRRIIGDRDFSATDVEHLAGAILEASDAHAPITVEEIVRRLVSKGRTRHKAEELARAVIR